MFDKFTIKLLLLWKWFLISPKWRDRLVKYRVCVIQLNLKEKRKHQVQQKQLLMIINIYAPTVIKAKEDLNTLYEIYAQIENIITEIKSQNTSVLL